MEEIDRRSLQEGKKAPRVPIKTYQWEDVRRSRIKGEYPWTHLSKPAYSESEDPKDYTMEALRRTRSACTVGKEETLEITELTNGSTEDAAASTEPIISEAQTPEPPPEKVQKQDALAVESADSSDNISQYLDKDEKDCEIPAETEMPGPSTAQSSEEVKSKSTLHTNGRKERAKSEEPKRKRKRSIDSSYSRVSLSKLGFLKKLKDAKNKIKMPKLSLSKPNLSKTKPKEESKQEKQAVKEIKKETRKELKDEKPVYIHIPLKPPIGQTDEFSYLEFEEKETKPVTPTKTDEKEQESEPESPKPQQSNSVQLIILTAPSDDEILDAPSVPETPSEGDAFFDNNKIEQLKTLAKHAVNEITPGAPKLETVAEETKENGNNNSNNLAEVESVVEAESETNKQQAEPKQIITEEIPLPDSVKVEENASVVDEIKSVADEEKMDIVDEPKPQKVEEKIIVDEEDGLKLSEAAIAQLEAKEAQKAEQDQAVSTKKKKKKSKEKEEQKNKDTTKKDESKSEEFPTNPEETATLKVEPVQDGSEIPKKGSIKKKVSFKRKSKSDEKDGEYEEVQDAKTVAENVDDDVEKKNKLNILGNSQSMSVDEEKTYLDEKIIKTTSLEEDYNKWSKISDHEYEPINPPPEETANASPPTLRITDTEIVGSTVSSTTSLDRRLLGTPQDEEPHMRSDVLVQDAPKEQERFLTRTPETISSRTDAEVHTSQVDSSAIEELPLKRENRKAQTEGPSKIQKYLRDQSGKFKTKLQGIKKPHITMPQRPKFDKFKFERPKINLPKIPDTTKISFPSFSLPRKGTTKRTLRERQFSTESNAGDSKKKIFDFSTYPRIFKKKPKNENESSGSSQPEFATVPRTYYKKNDENNKRDSKKSKDTDRWGGRDSIRVPLHSEDSMDRDDLDLRGFENNNDIDEREDSLERRMASHTRYNEDIDIDDAYEKENQEIHRVSEFSRDYNPRWNHGTFHEVPTRGLADDRVTDLDLPEPQTPPECNFDIDTSKETHSSGSSLEPEHRRGVLEEIDSDEFFLRQKGISQDNIDVGMYLSSEIREAFKSPQNALSQLQSNDFYTREYGSEQSLPEVGPKRRPVKKPKRKKTPHVSQEAIDYDQESILTEPEEYPKGIHETPARPKRRSKRVKKKQKEDVVPYQETIEVDKSEILKSNILSDNCYEPEHSHQIYENEDMKGIEQPEIQVSDSYKYGNFEQKEYDFEETPAAPPRKHKSLKSLTTSEHDSIIGEINFDKEVPQQTIDAYMVNHEYIIPTPEGPPVRPVRTRSHSRGTSQPDDDRTSRGAESLVSENQTPCVEEPCCQDIRDPMGYAIIDKQKTRDPPLPPRRSRSLKSDKVETKFFTVPRPLNDAPPTRPLRNYSTLGPSRPPRKKSIPNLTDEEKENIDITQYIEIDDEPNRNLVSGEIIQKMRDRPLPAPPRPPRKTRALQDITLNNNIITTSEQNLDKPLDETEVSTQTEPLPDDFVCEEPTQNIENKLLTPTVQSKDDLVIERNIITPTHYTHEETITHASLLVEPLQGAQITPHSQLTHQERIIPITKDIDYEDETSEIPEDFKTLKDPAPKVEEKTSVIERIIERPDLNTEVEILKAQKLQVGDLDVDRLTVNELQANKITVSEIDGVNIQVNEISSKTGALKVGELELPPNIVQELFEKLQLVANAQAQANEEGASAREKSADDGQKKTPIEEELIEEPPQRPPRQVDYIKPQEPVPLHLNSLHIEDICDVIEEITQNVDSTSTYPPTNNLMEIEEIIDPPQRPPRLADLPKTDDENQKQEENEESIEDSQQDQTVIEPLLSLYERLQNIEEPPQRPPRHSIPNDSSQERIQEPEVDDGPPPRPPQPVYLPSQPPASFYALRAQKYADYIDDDIPLPPRRKRQVKAPVSRSSSEDTPPALVLRRRARTPEASIPQLTCQLARACGTAADRSFKRLIIYVTENVLNNADGKQDLHVIIVILLVLIAGLILLGFGDGKTIHHHHWEFFNPPKNL